MFMFSLKSIHILQFLCLSCKTSHNHDVYDDVHVIVQKQPFAFVISEGII